MKQNVHELETELHMLLGKQVKVTFVGVPNVAFSATGTMILDESDMLPWHVGKVRFRADAVNNIQEPQLDRSYHTIYIYIF